ncbi:MAG TPA: hypothetical protein VHD36_17770 [Pirellulales bacterium]|nr:hypothetical protein [Pirellulales bacterium]
MSLLRSTASAGLARCLVVVLTFAWGLVSTLQAATVTISTADNEYRPGLLNQQYASYSAMLLVGGDKVQVGSGAGDANDVAAWDFSLPHGLNTVTGATLLIPLGTYLGSGNPDEVSITGITGSPVSDVLGDSFYVANDQLFWPGDTRPDYATGIVTPGGDPTTMIAFTLNQQAVDDINLHMQGSFQQAADFWFPVSAGSGLGTSTVFISNQPAQLVLTVVPEPGALVLSVVGGLFLLPVFGRTRKRITGRSL